MSPKYLVAAAVITAIAAPVSAQSVKAGIEAWQRADYGSAVAIWRTLAERGDADAQFNLGQAYRLGRGVPINLAMAKSWFERAASSGHLDAKTTLGLLLFQNGDQAQGLKWLKEAAEKGEPRAQLVYGTALYNGDGVTQDRMLGYAFVSRAASQGLPPAKETLAQLDEMVAPSDRQKAAALARSVPSGSPVTATRSTKPQRDAEVRSAPMKSVSAKASQPFAAKPKAASLLGGNWRIQLGAFAQRGAAEALFKRISGKAVLQGRTPYYLPVGSMTRLQAGPFASKAAAAAACASLGTACFPVPAK